MAQIVNTTLTPALAVSRSQIVLPNLIVEGSTSTMSFTLQTNASGVIANTDLNTLTLTHVDKESNAVIANRYLQDVLGAPAKLGANNVTISATSTLTWAMQTTDTVLLDALRLKSLETHVAVFDINVTIAGTPERLIFEVAYQLKRRFNPVTLN